MLLFSNQLQYELCLKGDEFNGDALSNTVAHFFHIVVIVSLVECEKSGATAFDRASMLNSSPFSKEACY